MTQTQIECFLSVCQTLNFTKTARALHYTPQGVSRLVSSMEKEFGLPLFVRSKTKMLSLTPAGEYCMDYLSRSQRSLSRTLGEIRSWYWDLASKFRLGISEWVDPYSGDLIRALIGFREKEPDLDFSAVSDCNSVLLSALEEGELDAVILTDNTAISNKKCEAIPLAKERHVLVVPESVCGADWGTDIDPQCWGVPFVQSSSGACGMMESEQIVQKQLALLRLSAPEIQIVPNVSSLSASLLVSRCVTISDARFGFLTRLPRLRYFPIQPVTNGQLYCLCSLCNENPRVYQFARYAREVLGDYTSDGSDGQWNDKAGTEAGALSNFGFTGDS